jgi:hypothetical protein
MNIIGFFETIKNIVLFNFLQPVPNDNMADPGTCEMGAIQTWSEFTLNYYSGITREQRRKNTSSDV